MRDITQDIVPQAGPSPYFIATFCFQKWARRWIFIEKIENNLFEEKAFSA